ncbi:flagellar export chaperone FlgN [Burkholderia sp. 22PA0099]|uniref:flagellar export chaperone FlgN n=1 Tax=Burkholderia sp. 22PA0099 TaxID=3237372 RepID=UPI0039C4119A
MSDTQRAARLLADLAADLSAYRELARLLDEQHTIALRFDGGRLAQLATVIGDQIAQIDARRRTRASELGPAQGSLARLQACVFGDGGTVAQRRELQRHCAELEARVAHCAKLATRNGNLLAAQVESVQRVLFGERHTYAPA